MFGFIIRLGVRNLLLHKLRSFLTMLGTILGVASVIAMLAVGEGSKQRAVEQIRSLRDQFGRYRADTLRDHVNPDKGKEAT